MKVLKPLHHTVTEYLEQVITKRTFFGSKVQKTIPMRDPFVLLQLYLRKPSNPGYNADFMFKLSPTCWQKICENLDAVYIGTSKDKTSDDEFFFYYYKGRYYITEIELNISDVATLIDQEKATRKQKLMKEVEMVKAKTEVKNGERRPIPEDVQIFVWNRDQGKCVKCGSNQKLEFDHIIPLSEGGSNTARNIQLLCERCNRSKGNRIGG